LDRAEGPAGTLDEDSDVGVRLTVAALEFEGQDEIADPEPPTIALVRSNAWPWRRNTTWSVCVPSSSTGSSGC